MHLRKLIQAWLGALLVVGAATSASAYAGLQEDADGYFAREDWPAAARAYTALLSEDERDADNWYRLGRVRQELAELDAAGTAFEQAIGLGYQPLARAQYQLARVLASLDQPQRALSLLEEIAASGGPGFRVVQNTPEFAALREHARFVAVVEALKPCNSAEYRQFDFWLGSWEVTPAGALQPTAVNEIASAQDGCVVFEQYTHGTFTGMSLSFYDLSTQRWHQTWMSNAGGASYLEGGLNAAGAMEMSDRNLPVSAATGSVNRVTWTPNDDGSVRQLWQNSADGGATWTVVFDGLYTRKRTSGSK